MEITSLSLGAEDDLRRVTEMAQRQVVRKNSVTTLSCPQ